MESNDIRDKLRQQREKWMKERDFYKDKEGKLPSKIFKNYLEITNEVKT